MPFDQLSSPTPPPPPPKKKRKQSKNHCCSIIKPGVIKTEANIATQLVRTVLFACDPDFCQKLTLHPV